MSSSPESRKITNSNDTCLATNPNLSAKPNTPKTPWIRPGYQAKPIPPMTWPKIEIPVCNDQTKPKTPDCIEKHLVVKAWLENGLAAGGRLLQSDDPEMFTWRVFVFSYLSSIHHTWSFTWTWSCWQHLGGLGYWRGTQAQSCPRHSPVGSSCHTCSSSSMYDTNKYLTSQISNIHQSYPDSPRTRRPWLGQCCSREPQGGVSSGSPVATC